MNNSTIGRNYAETLLSLARKEGDLRGWGAMITSVADAMQTNARLRLFLESPRVPEATKSEVLGKALAGSMPRLMVRFFQALVRNRRQMLIPDIARSYLDLVDAEEGRIHARVTVAREATADDAAMITAQLSRLFAKDVVPHFTVDESIMGGLVVHVGDTVLDGSVRKRLATLKRKMNAR